MYNRHVLSKKNHTNRSKSPVTRATKPRNHKIGSIKKADKKNGILKSHHLVINSFLNAFGPVWARFQLDVQLGLQHFAFLSHDLHELLAEKVHKIVGHLKDEFIVNL